MRSLNVEQSIIKALENYDYGIFKSERKFRERENITNGVFFDNKEAFNSKEFKNLDELLNEVRDEALYEVISETDGKLKTILYMKICGFSIKEISSLLGIPAITIYKKIEQLKKKIKKIK